MANREIERTVQLSVLDRLLDDAPRLAGDPPISRSESVRQHKRSLLRDIEWLLNTRRIADPAGDAFPEVQRSLYHYGLPDVTSLSGASEVVRKRLTRQVEECIQLFEPRLSNVRVTLVESEQESGRNIHFVIEGMLRMEPNPEHIAFDTVLQTVSGEFQVSGEADA